MKTIGKAEEIEFPDDFVRDNQVFKDTQNHYKEMDKLLKKFTKSSQSHSEDELGMAQQFKEYAATVKIDYGGGGSDNLPYNPSSSTYHTGLEVNKLFNMFDKMGSCLEQLAELRSNMNSDVSSILLSKVHEAMIEGENCKNFKEYYREAVVEHNVDETRYNTLKQKSNDLVKIKNAEKDADDKRKISTQLYENIKKEMKYQEELRDFEYLNAIRQFISAYRTYFIAGSQALDELESHLITGKSRSAIRSYDTNEILKYKDIQINQQQIIQQQQKSKKPKEEKQLFGVPLTTVMKRERELNRDVIPNMCIDLFDYVSAKGLEIEGIFRLAGEVVGMSYLKKMYDNGKKHLDIGSMIATKEIKDIHVAAGVLKMYIRELPEPLLTYDRYDAFLQFAQGNQDESIVGYGMLELVKQLPIEHIALLDRLMLFLNEVTKRSEENRMTHTNLSIVFGVNILKSQDSNPMKMARDSQAINKTCEWMIKVYPEYIAPNVRNMIEQFRQQRIQKLQSLSVQEESHVETSNEPFDAFEEESKKKGFLPPPSRAATVTSFQTTASPSPSSTSPKPTTTTVSAGIPKRPPLPSKGSRASQTITATVPTSTTPSASNPFNDDSFTNVRLDDDPFSQFASEQQKSTNIYPNIPNNNNKWDDPNDFF